MNVTGVIRRIDDLGRVVVPRDMRKSFGLQEGTPLEVCATEEGILFKKYDPGITLMDIVKNLESALDDNYVELGDRKSTRLNSSHMSESRMPSSA